MTRRAGDKRFDLVLSAAERETVNRLAGREGPQSWIKRLINSEIKRLRLGLTPLALRGLGRPKRSVVCHGCGETVEPSKSASTCAAALDCAERDTDVEFGPGYFKRTGGEK